MIMVLNKGIIARDCRPGWTVDVHAWMTRDSVTEKRGGKCLAENNGAVSYVGSVFLSSWALLTEP